jgi:hypothetical protein
MTKELEATLPERLVQFMSSYDNSARQHHRSKSRSSRSSHSKHGGKHERHRQPHPQEAQEQPQHGATPMVNQDRHQANQQPHIDSLCERKKPIPRKDESHIHIESKSDTPHEWSEDILLSNDLTSIPLVLSSSLLGCSDNDDVQSMEMSDSTLCESSIDEKTPTLEKMYMVHTLDDNSPCLEDDEHVSHLELPTSTTPTSKECDNKGNNIGVGDAMIPLVDMNMLSYECFTLSPIACNMLNNCSFPYIACNDDNDTLIGQRCPIFR